MSVLKDVGIRAETLNKRIIRLSDSDVKKWARESIESTKREFGTFWVFVNDQVREALVEHRIMVRFDQQDFDIAEFMPITELQKVRAAWQGSTKDLSKFGILAFRQTREARIVGHQSGASATGGDAKSPR